MRERAEKQEEERVARGEAPSEKGPQWRPGVAYEGKQLATSHNFHKGVDVFAEPDKVREKGRTMVLVQVGWCMHRKPPRFSGLIHIAVAPSTVALLALDSGNSSAYCTPARPCLPF